MALSEPTACGIDTEPILGMPCTAVQAVHCTTPCNVPCSEPGGDEDSLSTCNHARHRAVLNIYLRRLLLSSLY